MTKYALVTGASKGIGRELAGLLAQDEYNIVAVARDENELKKLAQELESKYKISVSQIPLDLSSPMAASELFKKVEALNISIDILVNNAGFGTAGNFWEIASEKEIAELQVNVVALTMITKLFLPKMVQRKSGKILNVASVAAFIPGPFMAVYFASKAYVLSFSTSLNEELKGTGISVTVLCPASTETNFANRAGSLKSKAFSGKLLNAHEVAKSGYEGMKKRKIIVFSDINSKVAITLSKFLPSTLVARLIRGSTQP